MTFPGHIRELIPHGRSLHPPPTVEKHTKYKETQLRSTLLKQKPLDPQAGRKNFLCDELLEAEC